MEILKEIFNGNLSGVGLLTSNEYKNASNKLIEMFDKIKEKLNEEDLVLFEDLMRASDEFVSISEEEFYKYGFKTGVLLGIECCDK